MRTVKARSDLLKEYFDTKDERILMDILDNASFTLKKNIEKVLIENGKLRVENLKFKIEKGYLS